MQIDIKLAVASAPTADGGCDVHVSSELRNILFDFAMLQRKSILPPADERPVDAKKRAERIEKLRFFIADLISDVVMEAPKEPIVKKS